MGLILCLLGTFALFEMQFTSKDYVYDPPEIDDDNIEYVMNEVKEFKEEIKPEEKSLQIQAITDEVKEIEDDAGEILKTLITEPEPISKNIVKVDEIFDVVPVEENIPVTLVQFVPIYPGCEKYKRNSKRAKCLNDKIGKLVQRKFDTDVAPEYGLTGVQTIFVQFKVDKTGQVTDIKTRAPHPRLREEAERTVNKIPKMKPGKMGDKPVNVIYTLPIRFKVEN